MKPTMRDLIIAALDSNLEINEAKDNIDGFGKCADAILKIFRECVPEQQVLQDIFWKNFIIAKDKRNNYIDDKKITEAIRQEMLNKIKNK